MKKFDNVPVEKDTRILFRKVRKLGEYDVLYEIWSWDGINAESIIFADDDVTGLEDSEIEEIVKKSKFYKKGSGITLKRAESGYTFVNFNFEVE